MILLIPHLIILSFLQIAAAIVFLIGTVAILFTGRYPLGLFTFFVGYQRWYYNVYGYMFHLFDEYPPFSMDATERYPVSFSVEYPGSLNRLLNFPILGVAVKALLCIPHLLAVSVLMIIAFVVVFVAQFAILFTGSFPAGMHAFVGGTWRWTARVQGYILALTDRYPPFSME